MANDPIQPFPADAGGHDGRGRTTATRSDLITMLAGAAAATVVLLVLVRGRHHWRYGLYYDEAWRSDLFRSSDTIGRYLRHDTPIPVGWLLSLKDVLPFG